MNSTTGSSATEKTAVDKAEEYYNSTPADEFYFKIWGGTHIHVGIYNHSKEPIKDASPRIVQMMASKLKLDSNTKLLDLGSGYGGAARYLAKQFGVQVTCLNLSETQNERNRSLNKEHGLENLITVVEGNFEDIPFPENSFDVAWSQDAIVHSADRELVVQEVIRVLNDRGEFIFTDLMQTYDCPKSILKPIIDRIELDSMGSFGFYLEQGRKLGVKKTEVHNLSEHLTTHYQRVMEETQDRYDEMVESCGKEYIDKMIEGLKHWVEAGKNNYLSWGIVHMNKSNVDQKR
jgi:cyclopropane fatty-acyl-phospholipid synthase-like methyltransferase